MSRLKAISAQKYLPFKEHADGGYWQGYENQKLYQRLFMGSVGLEKAFEHKAFSCKLKKKLLKRFMDELAK